MKKALFRLDSGSHCGLGHLIRSKALADALLKVGISSTFAVKHIHNKKALETHQVLYIQSEDEFLSYVREYELIIIDHYGFTSEHFHSISLILDPYPEKKLIVLDDECNRGQLFADVIVNPMRTADALAYKMCAPKAHLLLGAQYTLLRPEFSQTNWQDYTQRKSIIISFGGSDVAGLTLPVLKSILQSKISHLPIIVIVGAACPQAKHIQNFCLIHNVTYLFDVKNMATLFFQARLALSAAGSTVYELAYCGVPSVFAIVADNQQQSIEQQSMLGWYSMVDCRSMTDPHRENRAKKLVHKAEKMILNRPLNELSQIASSSMNANGADQVASYINKL